MIGHVGNRVGALVDGQLPDEEAERLWHHVHGCRRCSERVEREAWVKTQLAGLASAWPESAPLGLREGLSGAPSYASLLPAPTPPSDHRGLITVAALGAGSIGAAMMGVIALNVAADRPADRSPAATSLQTPPATSTVSRTHP